VQSILVSTAKTVRRTTDTELGKAVHRYSAFSVPGLRERLFTLAFRGLVYPQIWEDPVIDMEALAIQPGDHVVAIASGGCNILSYLTASPARITALDLNHAHIALTQLKLTAAVKLPSYRHFANFFANAALSSNIRAFDLFIADHLDGASRRYWQTRDMIGRRRISAFSRGFYRTGLLGCFIGVSHFLARLLGVNVGALLKAQSIEEQREFFEKKIAPARKNWLLRLILKSPASLYGLGVPPSQYYALAGDDEGGIAEVIFKRIEKLAYGFALRDNYFAWQAFARSYDKSPNAPRPPYLQAKNFNDVRARAGRVDARQESMTDFLACSPARTIDCFVLLDAQDWMARGEWCWSQVIHVTTFFGWTRTTTNDCGLISGRQAV
jgi:S-adenosylmethionine-diacylglycerol 3-amino-3-carboxypropyl transferase